MKPNPLPSQEVLKALFDYNPDTGALTRKKGRAISLAVNSAGYRRVWVGSKSRLAHRVVWKLSFGFDPSQIDHINRDRTDNRISNLREATDANNNHNTPPRRTNTSGAKGVSYCKRSKLWFAYAGSNGSRSYKYFKRFEDAVEHAVRLREALHGEFACHS